MGKSKNVLASVDVEDYKSRVGHMLFPKFVILNKEVFHLFNEAFLKWFWRKIWKLKSQKKLKNLMEKVVRKLCCKNLCLAPGTVIESLQVSKILTRVLNEMWSFWSPFLNVLVNIRFLVFCAIFIVIFFIIFVLSSGLLQGSCCTYLLSSVQVFRMRSGSRELTSNLGSLSLVSRVGSGQVMSTKVY